jgi:hypothetical protein
MIWHSLVREEDVRVQVIWLMTYPLCISQENRLAFIYGFSIYESNKHNLLRDYSPAGGLILNFEKNVPSKT